MHELGRCRLGLGEYDAAIDLGHKCLESADEAQDDIWMLNADMLIAQSHGKSFFSSTDKIQRNLIK